MTKEWPADKVERRSIDSLLPYAKNSRTHDEAQIAQIASSIKEWGWTVPCLIDETGTLIAGHGRILAARQLGIKDIPVMVATGWTEAQRRAYVIADNQIATKAGWNYDMLSLELGELRELDFDLGKIGFDDAELDTLLAEKTEGLTDPDETPEPPVNPVSRLGDVWLLGRHRVFVGDSTSLDAVERLMAGDKADLIVTDPPYGVNFERGKFVSREKAAKGPKFEKIANDELNGEELAGFIRDALTCAFAVAKDVPIYVWSNPLKVGTEILTGVEDAGFKVQSQIVWRKTPFVLGRADYQWQHEVCWYGFKGKNHPWYGGRNKGTVWDFPKPQKMDLHPTMKPIALIEMAINNSSKGGDIVLDLFGGSGSTLIACEKTGRDARLMELAPAYVDVIVNRWQGFTGQTATLEGSCQTFAEVCENRYAGGEWAQNCAGSYDDAVAAVHDARKGATKAD
jgi:DNA modification methylase